MYFCSIACFIGAPSAANPGPPSKAYHAHSTTSKRHHVSMSLPDKKEKGMKFVPVYIKNNDECLLTVKRRSEGPFMIIDSVLNHYGLPLELKYLAVIESELKSSAVSRVGAKGPWQLMPTTAHELGLTVSHSSDDRTNYYKSTRAAAKYLRDLHREFGDWLLVLAAYNGGPVPVYRAIHKAHSRNFWVLEKYLPAESRMHVKKFIATAYYFENADKTNAAPRVETAVARVSPSYTTDKPTPVQESATEKFARLMNESAKSLKTSNDLLGVNPGDPSATTLQFQ
jgi:membrane-bound lytic murein transglycosylase D